MQLQTRACLLFATVWSVRRCQLACVFAKARVRIEISSFIHAVFSFVRDRRGVHVTGQAAAETLMRVSGMPWH